MTPDIDPSQDFLVFDHAITVTLHAGGTALSVAGVTVSQVTNEQLQSVAGTLGANDVARSFSLPVANLASIVPADGATIVDDAGNTWIVISSDLATLGSRCRCVCRKQRGT
jgi:hypothetical protein